MKINGVRLNYDIYNKAQVKALQRGMQAIANASQSTESEEVKNENIKTEIYFLFTDVFGEETTQELLGTDPTLTDCMCAFMDFYEQYEDINRKFDKFSKNFKPENKNAIVRKIR